MMKMYKSARNLVDNEALLLRYSWYDVDLNKDNLISEKEFINVLNRININIKNPTKFFKQFIKDHHVNSKALTYRECMLLLQECKAHISTGDKAASEAIADDIWNQHFGVEKKYVTAQEFLALFLQTKQNEWNKTVADVQAVFTTINEIEANREEDDFPDDCMSRFRFELYLRSEYNDAYDPEAQKKSSAKLNESMAHYWINTSHNTYLVGDQLKSSSSVEMYMRALRRGCKCLELDCWDGESPEDANNECIPVVFHGHTLTSKIAFLEILHGVKTYLDAHPDTYPIILSLENHCSLPFQTAMAKNMKDVFGKKLYVPPADHASWENLPSPEALRGMVVIKGKRPPAPDNETAQEEPDFDPYGGEAQTDATADTTGSGAVPEGGNPNDVKVAPPQVVPELAELTLFHGTKFKSFEKSIALPSSHMHSIGETKIPKLIDHDVQNAKDWRKYNQRHMTRTYPAGLRVDSSNYNPMLAWATGCQLVALNFQTSDAPLLLNDGIFRQHGESGYLLKPPRIMGTSPGPLPEPVPVKIRIIHGSCLPKPFGHVTGEIIDPYVGVSLYDIKEGDGADTSFENVEETKYTKYVDDNGYCPVFQETFEFTVRCPDCAIFLFDVNEKDVAVDDKVGHSAIPCSCMRKGFRSIPLYDNDNTRSGAFGFATLLVEITF